MILSAASFAEIRWGKVEIAYFKVRGDNGQMISLPTNGIVLPVKMERISASPRQPQQHDYKPPLEEFFPTATLVYQNDKGNGTYFYDPFGPSACDDITILPSGNNQNWYDLTVAVHTYNGNPTRKVLLRQLGYNTYVAGRGAGVSALDGLQFDVGWAFVAGQFPPDPDPDGPGSSSWKFTLPIVNYWGILGSNVPKAPNGLIYFCQQWREYNLTGTGAFITGDFSPVFCGGGNPTIGSSADNYINDWDPAPDGIYDENENDYFGGSPNEANFLTTINTQNAGVQEVVRPGTMQILLGANGGGNIGSLYFVDANYLRINRALVPNLVVPSISVQLDGFVSTSNLTSLSLDVASSFTNGSFHQLLDAYNFSTASYVRVDERAMTTTDQRITIGVPGTPSQFVDVPSGNVMRMKISYKQVSIVPTPSYGCKIDLANWITTHP